MLLALELMPTADDVPPPAWDALLALAPDLLFVAEPPGLSNIAATARLARPARDRLVPHLTTRNLRREDVAERLGGWRGLGVTRVLALRGAQATSCDLARDQRLRSGRELIELLIALDPELEIWCAGYPEQHPEAASAEADLRALVAKVEAGASGIVCQFTVDAEPFLRFRDRVAAAGVDLPLLAGVMPLADAAWLVPFARDCGAALPAAVAAAFERDRADPAALEAFGIEHAAALVRRYRAEGVDGVEIFTRNAAVRTQAVLEAAGVR